MITFLLLSLPTIIATIPAFRWPLMNFFYGRKYRSHVGLFEVGEAALVGTYSVLYAMEKVHLIRHRLKIAQSRHKSYADVW